MRSVVSSGTVREWHDDEGWGVVDSPDVPGGCWVHFGAVAVAGYATLEPGQDVMLEWEAAVQDGYRARALRAWPAGTAPAPPTFQPPGPAYRSSLTIVLDEGPAPSEPPGR